MRVHARIRSARARHERGALGSCFGDGIHTCDTGRQALAHSGTLPPLCRYESDMPYQIQFTTKICDGLLQRGSHITLKD
eukprot:195118-Chlamydomonas_euryale.AAC.7